ncbi:hypothetical protein BX616_004180, partial [Lobosporangium transversale]
ERLNLQGKVGCAQCIIGATIIVLHAPQQSAVKTIQEFQHFMAQPVFLSWMILIVLVSLWLIWKAGPRWGKEHMMVYIGICSLIGSLSVVATQALGAAIVHNISTGEPQFNIWFTYFVIIFMVITLLIEINYLNKALNLFNTAMVTPTYYVTFTSATIITSAILYQGFHASVVAILSVVFGFFVICGGVLLLQTSKPVVPLPPIPIPENATDASELEAAMVSTILYEELEPTAADMRASPFSSIRRISRDLRQPSIISNHYSSNNVFQSSPLNPRAESLLQRKRRASNATTNTAPWSRPQSIAGSTTAFYPSSSGTYSSMAMGPNGAQVRLQLCEIVVSDEKNETSRYQVYRPIPTSGTSPETNANIHSTGLRHSLLGPRRSMLADSRSSSIRFSHIPSQPASADEINEKSDHYHHPQSTPSQGQKHSSAVSGSMFLPPRVAISSPTPSPSSNVSTSSNTASIALNPNTNNDPSTAPSPQQQQPTMPAALLLPPPPKTSPSSGSLLAGGPFFRRPTAPVANKLRPSSIASSAFGGDIMEMNDPGHTGKTVISIEPVQQQPLFSLYITPPPPSTLSSTTTASGFNGLNHFQHHGPKSVPVSSLPLSGAIPTNSNTPSSTIAAHIAGNINGKSLGQKAREGTEAMAEEENKAKESTQDGTNGSNKHNDNDRDDTVNGSGGNNDDYNHQEPIEDVRTTAPLSKPTAKPRRSLFGLSKLFGLKERNKYDEKVDSDDHYQPPLGTTLSTESSSSTTPLNPIAGARVGAGADVEVEAEAEMEAETEIAIVASKGNPLTSVSSPSPTAFHRTNHPTTRISEGEEEEDVEDLKS